MTNETLIIGLLVALAVAFVVLGGIAISEIYELRHRNAKLTEENSALYKKCEDLADENATLHSENIKLQARSFGVMMCDWKRIEDDGRVYYEKDKIRLIVEDGKVVGWYRP